MNRFILISLLCLAWVISTDAQPITSVKADDLLEAADQAIEQGNFLRAIEMYREYYRENKNVDVALSIAYGYYKIRNFESAERYYTRVLEEDVDNIFIDDRYAYGRTLRSLGDLPKARQQFEMILALSADDQLKALSQIELDGIDAQQEYPQNEKVEVKFAAGDINSGSAEYSPQGYDDKTIYFSSFKRSKEIVIDGSEKKYHAKIYKSEKKEDGYGKPEALDRKINRDGWHVGNVSFSDDNRKMYFTRQLLEYDEVTTSQIFYSNLGDDDWGAAEPLPGVNGDWIAKHPAVGELLGTRVLFFVSDMEGGQGGTDIYYVTISGDRVSAPVNLGEEINTPYDEITPHYHDGTLYFSTEGRSGMGGLDIFQSTWDGNTWSIPRNLGAQYNTPLDDWYLSFDKSGSKGFLVSNREDEAKKSLKGSKTCCYDIYEFEIRQLKIDLLVGVGNEEEKPLKGATVEVTDITTYDPPMTQTQEEEYRFKYDLKEDRRYQVITSKEGYTSDTLEVNTGGIVKDESIRKKVILRKAAPKKPVEPQVTYRIDTVTINEAIRFDNIYYEFDKWDILSESEEDLTIILNLMNQYDNMVIELSSHTDARGPGPYNKQLSQRRAESARLWLINRGVAPNRIVPKGYGETNILNRCTNGVLCPDTEHRFNRRTEFKILEGPQTIEIKREVKNGYNGGKQSFFKGIDFTPLLDTVPVMTFQDSLIDLDTMVQGEKKKLVYNFTNTGNAPLVIDLATTCKCTDIKWPTKPIAPGETGEIEAVFDSSGFEGPIHKTIDIIANTDPIVVEAKFVVQVVLAED